jgi:STE24 endopeptidase
LTAIALPILLALVRRMPRRYWIVPALAASLWLFWVTAHNGYERIAPLPPGALRADIEAMAQGSGLSPDRIHMGEQKLFSGGLMDAHAIWWRGKPQAILSERLFNVVPVPPQNIRPPYRPVTAAEVRAIAGHELAHLRLMHLYFMPAILIGLAWLLAWLACAGTRALVSKFGPSWRVAGSTDPAALPAIALTFGIAFYASLPLSNAVGQAAEIQADAAGLDIARDPDGAAALAMREARGRPISHPVVEQWLFYDHPSPLHRIRHAMAWKARHRAATWSATGLSAPITVGRWRGLRAAGPEMPPSPE